MNLAMNQNRPYEFMELSRNQVMTNDKPYENETKDKRTVTKD